MKMLHFFLITLLTLLSGAAIAHGPTPQKIDESIAIAAPIETVWNVIKDFGSIEAWHPLVDDVTLTDEQTRTINIVNKGKLTDSVDEINEAEYLLSYRLLEEDITVFPVSFYTITLTLKESDEGSTLLWRGRFYRADTGNFPPDDLNDESAVKAMKEFAQQGMAELKVMLETK